MFFPATYGAALALMLAGMVLWGSWANMYRLANKWPFSLFYLDYAVGIFATSLLVAGTLGTWFGGETFRSNLLKAEAGAVAYALAAGVVWNVANLLLVAAMGMVGMAVAFPVAIGLALVLGACSSYIAAPKGDPLLLFSGVALVLLAVVLNSMAWRCTGDKGGRRSLRGLWVCVSSGVLFSASGPLLALAQSSAEPLAPYGIVVLYTLGALISAVLLTLPLFRWLAPESSAPSLQFWQGNARQHAAGLAGGVLWALGTAFTFVPMPMVGTALAYAIGYSNPLVAALWGTFVWKEFRGASARAHRLLAGMFLCYFAGLILQSFSFVSER